VAAPIKKILLKQRPVGNSVTITLPKELLAKLGAKAGDKIVFTETADGSFHLSVRRIAVDKQLNVATGVTRRYRNALRKLAK
jgi:putative addiction module antidote